MNEESIDFEQIDDESGNPDQKQWAHEILTDFETLIDVIGVESVMFLMSQEHENVLNSWVKRGVDIQHKTKQ